MTLRLTSRFTARLALAAGVGLHVEIDVLVQVPAGADGGAALLRRDDVEVVEPGGAADLAHDPRPAAAAGELGRRGGELGELEGREVGGGAVEEDARQHLVLRQRRLGGEGDLRRRHPALDGHDGGDVLRARLGHEVDLRVEVAHELQRALVEVDALAEDQDAPAAQVELADRLDVGARAPHRHLPADLHVEPAAAHEDLGSAR